MPDFKQKFYDITSLIQTEFDRNLDMYGDKIQCRKGCSKCCSQIFRITLLDGWMINEHVRSLPDARRNELQQKAREYLKHVASVPRTDKDTQTGLPCPALGLEGECTIYEARPVICRRFGMPIYDYKNPANVHACELNFKDGDEITDTQLIPNQTDIGMKWDELKEDYNNSLLTGERTKIEGVEGTTIAEAIANA